MIGIILGERYEILEQVGEGGMAIVYRAKDRNTNHDVAIKFLKPEYHENAEFVTFFKREAKAVSRMSHHNIVNLLDVGDDENGLYIVIEYVHGKTLKDIIKERGRIQENLAAQIIIRILSALQHAHDAGIVHRDIKPQNILVDRNGYIKVSDFGIARMVGSQTELTHANDDTVMGSVHYFSPEQARGETATFSSDIYATGIVFYELLTGRLPFEGDTPVAIALKHINQPPQPIRALAPDVSPAIEAVVQKALSKDPNDRYDSALSMAQAINKALKFPERDPSKDTPVFTKNREKSKNRVSRLTVRRKFITLFATLIVLFALLFGSVSIFNYVTNKTQAPYVIGETEEDAKRMVINAWLKPEIVRQSSSQPAGTVILQSHDFGYPMQKNDTFLLTVSTGPLEKPVPNLLGKSEEEAKKITDGLGLNLLVSERVLDSSAMGTVLSQTPQSGNVLSSGGVVQVKVSGGKVTLPDVTGLYSEEGVQRFQNAGLPLSKIKVTQVPVKDSAQFNRIADQLPEAGSVVMPADATLEVVIAVYVSEEKRTDD
jgi:serine/threonine-protein kinase